MENFAIKSAGTQRKRRDAADAKPAPAARIRRLGAAEGWSAAIKKMVGIGVK